MASQKHSLLGMIVWLALTSLPLVEGHGRLMEPPSRSSLWRFGLSTAINYDDNALNCGGLNTEWYVNHGKCGVCGDPWEQAQPRDNEAGGKYGKGIIAKTYASGQVIPVRVDITANHMGWFEFRLCVHNSPSTPITQECLDKHLLQLADGSGTRYPIDPHAQAVELKLKLPDGVSCSQCVLQWKWHGGNNFGTIQEEFYGCSDIAIGPSPATSPTSTTSPPTPKPTTAQRTSRPTTRQTVRPTTVAQTTPGVIRLSTPGVGGLAGSGDCHAVGQLHGVSDLDRYCREQCPVGNCPPAYCVCTSLPVVSTATPGTVTPSTASTQPPTPRPTTTPKTSPVVTTTQRPVVTTKSAQTTVSSSSSSSSSSGMVCRGVGVWQGVPELDLYCNEQCPVGNCPSQCSCTAVSAHSSQPPTTPTHTPTTPTHTPTTPTYPQTSLPSSLAPTTTTHSQTTKACVAIGSWHGDVSKDQWCNTNCPFGLCSALNCRCSASFITPTPAITTTTPTPVTTIPPSGTNPCRAVGPWAADAMLDKWCKQNCYQFSGCDPQYCRCDGAGGTTTSVPTPGSSTPSSSQVRTGGTARCHAINSWAGDPDLDLFCETQCRSGHCPPEYCSCGSAAKATTTTTTTTLPTTTTTTTTLPTTTTTTLPTLPTTTATPSPSVRCYGVNSWAGNPDLDSYCDMECKAGLCPPQYCACGPTTALPYTTTIPKTTTSPSVAGATGGVQVPSCHAVGSSQGVPEMDAWCRTECAAGNCPPVYCAC
ncbi:hypothetical protein ACOMHN_022743 [Nucella lapillus]